MDNKLYIDYLNSLHNYNAQNENAYGERNIDNPYFKDVMVRGCRLEAFVKQP